MSQKSKKSVARRSKNKTAPVARRSRVAAAPAAARSGTTPKQVREGSKLAIIVGLLTRPEGCTVAEVLEATEWPSVSMPQQAKAAGLTLVKEGRPARYRAAVAA